MAYKYLGDVELRGNFSVLSKKPLDAGSIVDTLEDVANISSDYMYNGKLIIALDDRCIYILLDADNHTVKESWFKIGNAAIDPDIDLSEYVTVTELNSSIKEAVDSKFSILSREDYENLPVKEDKFYFIKKQ